MAVLLVPAEVLELDHSIPPPLLDSKVDLMVPSEDSLIDWIGGIP